MTDETTDRELHDDPEASIDAKVIADAKADADKSDKAKDADARADEAAIEDGVLTAPVDPDPLYASCEDCGLPQSGECEYCGRIVCGHHAHKAGRSLLCLIHWRRRGAA